MDYPWRQAVGARKTKGERCVLRVASASYTAPPSAPSARSEPKP